jgi:hypothetical protein
MTQEPMEQDTDVRRALIDGGAAPLDDLDVTTLGNRVGLAAASELRRRRQRHWRRRLLVPGALAAGLVLFAVMSRSPQREQVPPLTGDASAGRITIEEVLDADVSDDQFRVLLSGADEADELLLIAAQEQRQ